MKKICSFLETGIGNRLQQMYSAVRLAEMHGAEYMVEWRLSRNCAAHYHDLFNEPLNLVHDLYSSPRQITGKRIIKYNNGIAIPDKVIEDYDTIIFTIPSFVTGEKEHIKDTFEYIRYKFWNTKLNEYVKTLSDWFHPDKGSIGVHVRRGDALEKESFRCVPLNKYFNVIDSKYPNKKIFLSTDCKDVAYDFLNRYGTRVFYQPLRSYDQFSRTIAQDGLVDIISLSRTYVIITGESSFSKFASVIGDTPRVVLK